jgi:hypothetical protein
VAIVAPHSGGLTADHENPTCTSVKLQMAWQNAQSSKRNLLPMMPVQPRWESCSQSTHGSLHQHTTAVTSLSGVAKNNLKGRHVLLALDPDKTHKPSGHTVYRGKGRALARTRTYNLLQIAQTPTPVTQGPSRPVDATLDLVGPPARKKKERRRL